METASPASATTTTYSATATTNTYSATAHGATFDSHLEGIPENENKEEEASPVSDNVFDELNPTNNGNVTETPEQPTIKISSPEDTETIETNDVQALDTDVKSVPITNVDSVLPTHEKLSNIDNHKQEETCVDLSQNNNLKLENGVGVGNNLQESNERDVVTDTDNINADVSSNSNDEERSSQCTITTGFEANMKDISPVDNNSVNLEEITVHKESTNLMEKVNGPEEYTNLDSGNTNGPEEYTYIDSGNTNGPEEYTNIDSGNTNGPEEYTNIDSGNTNGPEENTNLDSGKINVPEEYTNLDSGNTNGHEENNDLDSGKTDSSTCFSYVEEETVHFKSSNISHTINNVANENGDRTIEMSNVNRQPANVEEYKVSTNVRPVCSSDVTDAIADATFSGNCITSKEELCSKSDEDNTPCVKKENMDYSSIETENVGDETIEEGKGSHELLQQSDDNINIPVNADGSELVTPTISGNNDISNTNIISTDTDGINDNTIVGSNNTDLINDNNDVINDIKNASTDNKKVITDNNNAIISDNNIDIISENNDVISDNNDVISDHSNDVISGNNDLISENNDAINDNDVISDNNNDVISDHSNDVISGNNDLIDENNDAINDNDVISGNKDISNSTNTSYNNTDSVHDNKGLIDNQKKVISDNKDVIGNINVSDDNPYVISSDVAITDIPVVGPDESNVCEKSPNNIHLNGKEICGECDTPSNEIIKLNSQEEKKILEVENETQTEEEEEKKEEEKKDVSCSTLKS